MKTRRPAVLSAGAIVLLALIVMALVIRYRDTEAQARREMASLEQAQIKSEQTLDRLRQDLADTREETVRMQEVLAKEGGSVPTSPSSRVARWSHTTRIRSDPAYQAAYLQTERLGLRMRYAGFYRKAGLTAEEIETFEELVSKWDEAQMDLRALAMERGVSSTDADLAAFRQQVGRELHEAQLELLGPERYRLQVDFDRTRAARQNVEGLAGAAAIAGVPFTRDQAEQLQAILVEAGGGADSERFVNLVGVDWASADARIRAVLSPAQFDIYQSSAPTGGGSRHLTVLGQLFKKARESESGAAASGR